MSRGAVLLALILSSCNRPSVMRSAVTHGAPDHDDPATVALVLPAVVCGQAPIVICTGTLVAGRAVLTAAHCLKDAPLGVTQVFFGDDARGTGERLDVISAQPHPDDTVDLAILALATLAPATPVPMRTQPLDGTAVGATVRVVGFGADEQLQSGLKRQGTAAIDQVDAATFRIRAAPALSCNGDSGGPVLLDRAGVQELAGVTSFGDPQCTISGTNVRVDTQASFIAATLAAIAQLPSAPPRAAIDPDADWCSQTCGADADCPAGMACTDGRCALLGQAAGRFGTACVAGADTCGTGTCVAVAGACRCLQPCMTPFISGGGCSVSRFGRAR